MKREDLYSMLPLCILAIEDESDREFMARIFVQYQWLMYRTIEDIVKDHWVAEDVVQATVEKLIDKMAKLKALEEKRLANYIITACRHNAYNELRYQSRHPIFSIDEEWDTDAGEHTVHSVEADLIRGEDLRRMAEIWDMLDPRNKFVLEARYILEKTDAEIAEELCIRPNSVRMVLTRARKQAYELMQASPAPAQKG